MSLNSCGLSQTALPALGRLIQSPGFEHLQLSNDNDALFEGPALPAFCEALHNCTSLRTLGLDSVNLWADLAVATQLFDALEGLPALQKLSLCVNSTEGSPAVQRAAGECLARLNARSSSLRVMDVSYNELGEAGMTPIFQALRNNSSLTELVFRGEQISASAEFARDVVLPAVRANTCLRKLQGLHWVGVDAPEIDSDADEEDDVEELLPALQEVWVILEARRLADKEAA